MYKVTKIFTISCSHRLHCPELTDETNRVVFGKCNNPDPHGHNFKIAVTLKSENLKNGMVMNFKRIKEIFKGEIDHVYDHNVLNKCKGFEELVPTAENMAKVFYRLLKIHISELYSIRVWETDDAYAEYQEGEE